MYFELERVGMLVGLQKFAGRKHRQRASSPKLHALNTALMSALSGYTFTEARNDRSFWGRLVESAVDCHLYNTAPDLCEVRYWRESPFEVDFVLKSGGQLLAIEVKSGGRLGKTPDGLNAFAAQYPAVRTLVVGESGIPLGKFLAHPATRWLEGAP